MYHVLLIMLDPTIHLPNQQTQIHLTLLRLFSPMDVLGSIRSYILLLARLTLLLQTVLPFVCSFHPHLS